MDEFDKLFKSFFPVGKPFGKSRKLLKRRLIYGAGFKEPDADSFLMMARKRKLLR